MTNQTARILELLKRFNSGQKVCIEALKYEYLWEGMSERNIRRDFSVIRDHFSDSFVAIRGEKCYKALIKKSFENFLTPQNRSLLVQAFNISQMSESFDSFNIDTDDKKLLTKLIEENRKIYEFKNKPFERKSGDIELFKILEDSIYQQKHLEINYNGKTLKVKPYKILFMQENFYLACERDDEYKFSLLRISQMKKEDITQQSKTFHKDMEISDFINDIQTPFSRYTKGYKDSLITVLLEIDASKSRYFKVKDFLKSQEIVEEKEDGTLLVSYRVTQTEEVKELIKRWIPFVKVLEPKELREEIQKELQDWIDNN